MLIPKKTILLKISMLLISIIFPAESQANDLELAIHWLKEEKPKILLSTNIRIELMHAIEKKLLSYGCRIDTSTDLNKEMKGTEVVCFEDKGKEICEAIKAILKEEFGESAEYPKSDLPLGLIVVNEGGYDLMLWIGRKL